MRLIDADAIPYRDIWREDWLNNAGKYQQGVFRDEIEEMPTVDAVPVIRCKDCKNFVDEEDQSYCIDMAGQCDGNGFCAWAERKDNG